MVKRFKTEEEFKEDFGTIFVASDDCDEGRLDYFTHVTSRACVYRAHWGKPITESKNPELIEDWMTVDEMSEEDEQKALRYNEGKIDLSLIPTEATKQECLVWMDGEKKYGRDNWKKLWGESTTNVVMASLLRHAFAILEGEINDPETGKPHAAHIRCNAAMLLEYYKENK